MRITQCYVAKCLSHFEKRFREKYKLHNPHTDDRDPCVFFGCYSASTLRRVLKHNSLSVIVWAGGDAKALRKYMLGMKKNPHLEKMYMRLMSKPNVRHIAISKYIEVDLTAVGLPFKKVRVNPCDTKLFLPVPMGDAVYVYGYQQRPEVYNAKVVDKVRKLLPQIRFLHAHFDGRIKYEPHQMPQVYRQCFAGLRLTTHDGLPNTVIELGLMGRRVVSNSELPNTIPWNHSSDVAESIITEFETRHEDRSELVKEMRCFVDCGEDWLDTEYYR